MKRDAYCRLLEWKKSRYRKPLILQGARQVGKTYILKEFGKREYPHLLYLNFEEDPGLYPIFSQALDPKRIIQDLALYTGKPILPENTLLIWDEIQECPEALNSLKYFNEQENAYHIVAAGSLLGVKFNRSKGFPVGKVDFQSLYPCTFFEFLEAIHEPSLRSFLEALDSTQSINEAIHQKLIRWLKYYFFVGGMPEAIRRFNETQDLGQVRQVQEAILKAYQLDFSKHAPAHQIMKIGAVWASVPSQLAKESKKFVFSVLGKSARGREYLDAIEWLSDAGLMQRSFQISVPKLPLEGYSDKQCFKAYCLDVGLLGAMARIPAQALVTGDVLFNEYRGAFTENFVAQALTAEGREALYYWASPSIAEVDFIVPWGQALYPLEVKAGSSSKKKSLRVYGEKYNPPQLSRATTMNLANDGKIFNLPLYLVGRFPNILRNSSSDKG